MRLALQIFLKDFERLWWIVLLTLALLVVFVFDEAAHQVVAYPIYPAPNGGWLNLALPFAWSLLIALVINQDPLAGDRQFWVSLPCGWQPLAVAKAAFIAASIQIPYLIATAAVLIAKGLNPLEHIPHLLWKQLVLLAFVLPAVAVATMVKNIAQFLLVLITIVSGLILLTNRINQGYRADTAWDIRWDLSLAILGVGALAIVILQFVRRETRAARVIGIVFAIAAFSLYNWLSRDMSAAIGAALSPAKDAAPVSVTVGSAAPSFSEQQRYYNARRTTFLIPIRLSGLGSHVKLDQISLSLSNGSGRYEAQWARSSDDVRSQRISTGLDMYIAGAPFFQWLEVGSADISKRLLSGPVTIEGRILAQFYEPGQATTLRTAGRTDVPGLGYCIISHPIPTGRAMDRVVAIECDSPELSADEMLANRSYFLRDRFIAALSHYPQDPWLSPLHSATGFGMRRAGDNIAPTTSLGSAVIGYTFRDVDLNQFLVHEVRP